MSLSIERQLGTLRCPGCTGRLRPEERIATENGGGLYYVCEECGEQFPVVADTPRLLLSPLREALLEGGGTSAAEEDLLRTARSFGFEWNRFPEMYSQWNQTFLMYMQPHSADFFQGKKVLDAGCGNGRFAYYAATYGAEVWAIDLGSAVDVARRNTAEAGDVQVVQAELQRPPFAPESFDFIYSIGVLHHLPDPEAGFRSLLRYLKPGGEIQIYLYWRPERQPIKLALLQLVTAARMITTRLPHHANYALAFPAALGAFAFFVWPYRLFKKVPGLREVAEKFPMKQYAVLPFRVCVNDQLDRFSAPIENRYTREQVTGWLQRAGLEGIEVKPYYGWVCTGRKPVAATVNG